MRQTSSKPAMMYWPYAKNDHLGFQIFICGEDRVAVTSLIYSFAYLAANC